ncbi:ferredoxin [Phaeobacter porticola]|uniref:4Fe-4S ferredoxin-type domain-containing protein n=1 Tax=Phaeobacter porticola TaxID=1844006 RepID=A0A1L3I189_9RHOB|nr:ferredoxin [Phaeobacter porticola]APG45880.1 hypothetical protein PhaeoP97_00430 [Phaeobacter porticola]
MTSPPCPESVAADRSVSMADVDPNKTAPNYAMLQQAATAHGLDIYGGFHPTATQRRDMVEIPTSQTAPNPALQQPAGSGTGTDACTGAHSGAYPGMDTSGGTLILLGTGASYWAQFTASAEYLDTAPNPVDRWSSRVIGDLAYRLGATPYYPFTGPPYAPFVAWALASGRSFTSPSQMLVHDHYGMMISYRGALYFAYDIDLPTPPLAQAPCLSCADQPCLTTCPAEALENGGPYKLAACHDHLDTTAGTSCLSYGCRARCACPLSTGANRTPAQSAHHMRYFHIK